jgi:NAD+ synthase (glutamine-hydrolysing)
MIGEWAEGAGPELSAVLTDILDTPVSPELLPDEQHTESIIGKYDLHDFFLYYFVKFGEEPDTLTALAEEAFRSAVKPEEIKKALSVFIRRFVSQQFKRNAAPDGPKTGEIGLSQRTDWKSPSDMSSAIWSTWI